MQAKSQGTTRKLHLLPLILTYYFFLDGCHFSHFGCWILHCYQMDKTYGLSPNLQFTSFENLEVTEVPRELDKSTLEYRTEKKSIFYNFRVNLTFRVKSAHKLKLTDKQLLQWLFPILLVMMVYLSAWTLSDPPEVGYLKIRSLRSQIGSDTF